MGEKNILFLLDNPFTNDRRVYREAVSLAKNGYHVTLVGVKTTHDLDYEIVDGVHVYRIIEKNIYDIKLWKCFDIYAKEIILRFNFNIIHAHDQIMLNLGVKIKQKKSNVKLIYDSHELFRSWPLNTKSKGWIYLKSIIVRFLLKKREARNIKFIDALLTVNESIRLDILTYFNLNIPSGFVRNIPEYTWINKKSNILRGRFNIPETDKILVYIGANIYPRTINIEQVIFEFANKEDVTMIFICDKNWGRFEIQKYANNLNVKNLFFHDLVSVNEIPIYLSSADVGIVSSWNKKDLSYWYGLDNKLFEYMMSEIPILATRQPEYINVVEKYNIGICINPDEESYYDAFKKIIENYSYFYNNVKKTKNILNWEKESLKLLELYDKVID